MKLIAEVGSNIAEKEKTPDLNRALALIDAASWSGATHVKFQLFTGETLHSDYSTQKYLNLLALRPAWIPQLAAACREAGMEFLCTPFSVEAVDYLDDFVDEWKVASGDITFIPLLTKLAQNGKPVILSTGVATMEEIEAAIELLRPGDEFPYDITLLHCHGGYPIPLKEFDMRRMVDIVSEFSLDLNGGGFMEYGLSSHYPDPILNASSVLLGATVIEAHFDLEDRLGTETRHSLTPVEFKTMVEWAEKFRIARGTYNRPLSTGEQFERDNARRSPEDWLRPAKR